jgi:probable rRNA maturation factor
VTLSVFGSDEQQDVSVDLARWVRLARMVVQAERVPGLAELSLLFVDQVTIAELNEKFLGGAGPTDVLAFPMDDDLVVPGRQPDQGGRGPGAPSDGAEPPTLIGDVVVCPAVAAAQAPEHRATVDEEIALLVVHGVLHLLHYDHADPRDEAAMKLREQELLARFRDQEQGTGEPARRAMNGEQES